jgi:hypothetical protein
MEKPSTPSQAPLPLKEALASLSRQQRRAVLRKGYQAQLRAMGAPLTRKETRLVANSTGKTLLSMLREEHV